MSALSASADPFTPIPLDELLIEPDVHAIAKNLVPDRDRKLRNAPTEMELANAITDVENNPQMKGGSSIVVHLADAEPPWKILDSGIFDTNDDGLLDPIDLNYPDGSKYWWTLTQVSPRSDRTIALTFMNRSTVTLMRFLGPVRGDRAQMTRAEFLASLAKHAGIPFTSRELHIKEPIAITPTSGGAPAGVKGTNAAGNQVVTSGKAWAVRASSELASSGDGWTELSSNGNGARAAGRPQTATGTGGWDFAALGKAYPHGTRMIITNPQNGRSGVFPMTDVGNGSSFAPAIGVTPAVQAALGLTGDQWVLHIQLADGSDMNVVPGFGTPVSGVHSGVMSGPGGSSSSKIVTTAAYYFEINAGETYWDGMNRLADEVDWRLYLDGDHIYYDSEMELIKKGVSAVIDRDDPNTVDWSYDWDARAIVTQMQLSVIADMFWFKVGEVLQLTHFGAASTCSTAAPKRRPGCWLIDSVTRNKRDLHSVLTLKQPEKQKSEPAPQTSTSSASSSVAGGVNSGNKNVDAFIAEAIRIGKMHLPYVWGGGHGSFNDSRGYDCSGYISACMHAAGWLNSPLTSGDMEGWGAPGPGKFITIWCNSGHVFAEIKVPGSNVKRVDTVWDGGGPQGPQPRYVFPGPEGTAGFTPRHWPGT